MAMAVGTTKGPKSDINITPYIDILLVLLIIFMVITPVHQVDLEVKVPQSPPEDAKALPPPPDVIVVSMSETAQLAINQEPVSIGELGPKLLEIYSARANKNMFISASAKLPYGDVVKIIDIAKGAGVQDVGLLTELR
jgi:biopolymer transport protein ExbD